MKRTRLRPRRQSAAERQAWDLAKQRVWLRARGRCEHCRRANDLDVHHEPKRSQGNPGDLDHLVALCRRCHDWTDAPYAKGRLVVTPLGSQRFRFAIVTAPDKFTVRTVSASTTDRNGAGISVAARSRRRPDQHPVVLPRSDDLYPTVPQRRGR